MYWLKIYIQRLLNKFIFIFESCSYYYNDKERNFPNRVFVLKDKKENTHTQRKKEKDLIFKKKMK